MHFFHYSLQNRRQESRVNSAPNNAIQKYQFTTPIQFVFIAAAHAHSFWVGHAFIIWFHLHEYFTKLPRPARLLFMPVIGLNRFTDGFPVGNSWFSEFYMQVLRDMLQFPFDNGKM